MDANSPPDDRDDNGSGNEEDTNSTNGDFDGLKFFPPPDASISGTAAVDDDPRFYGAVIFGDFRFLDKSRPADDAQFISDYQAAHGHHPGCYKCLEWFINCDADGHLSGWCRRENESHSKCIHCIHRQHRTCRPVRIRQLRYYADLFQEVLTAPVFNKERFKAIQRDARAFSRAPDAPPENCEG
ncbi:hypothetical protein SAPIO_CDS6002 [Scedosporium apiospermum]|uniref:Uncharacterized protein n=1 Tax=Pseudallescheria apiosperma TaxID=563466 RepID=A0A084G5W3_PSEDA|nr:uncharacterized protein SAPIO_CDS6002 [Scedosporium apiospermum]KEZ42725.1 hypothetical protein SAPIO_CDS6002 [Scedosporium apiospermum]